MPEFAHPFPGDPPHPLSGEGLLAALRVDLAGELEAITLYLAQAGATDDPRVKTLLEDIAHEEMVHMGELLELLRLLDPKEGRLLNQGRQEAKAKVGDAPKESWVEV